MRKFFTLFSLCLLPLCVFAEEKVVNIYAWTGEVPDSVIRAFENETGIKVNISTYDNNEIMYAKLRASKAPGYDIVNPSSYFVDRMRRLNMLEKLDKSKLPNWKNLNPVFLHSVFDPKSEYSVPNVWGVTGIFYNTIYYPDKNITKWADLWEKRFYNKLLLVDDTREVFSMALLSLGYSANDQDPAHIKAAFLKLKALMQNVKMFSSDAVASMAIDEDATVGMAWNGDAFKAWQNNKNVHFIYPQEGFVIWVDNLVIPQNAPHKEAAYAFINFMMRADNAEKVALNTNFPTANLAAQKLLPENIRNNPDIYPPKEIMQRGQFQQDMGDDTLALFEKYWEELKLSG